MAMKRMLIDAAHQEETRVALMNGNQLEELDVESSARKQLKGNIYLAKVTRVEPSLQAAFVDYGGNRHGFLAFSEIHPDYYQIPVADREQLIAEDEEARAADTESEDEAADEVENEEMGANSKAIEIIGGDDIDEVEDRRRIKPLRRYKIQEVIKRRQILLVQVVKEERGNKGAALTTYLSLAGRYCVLMPNTGKGGGISRKIGSGADRKRLKTIVSSLDIPEGMAVIVRTAGAERGKPEIKRDFEYLIRLWNDVRELTLASQAPNLINEEANIIKRALRDMYTRDVDEVFVEGDDGYRSAKDLMKQLIPSHAKRVQPYKDPVVPVFSRYKIENQLESMLGQEVQLKSGGYIVINATEALVAVDVNSGRATRGRNIEETALKTNMEAATEIARQLRLRDMAGLIVIDFIDMDFHRNQIAVERRLKEAMRRDRARIQIGRISPFGLLELSRQRLRPSITETTTDVCPHCSGSGILRSTESTALHVLRGIDEECAKKHSSLMNIAMPSMAALYILNQKREALAEIEQKFKLKIDISVDDNLIPPNFTVKRIKAADDGLVRKTSETVNGDLESSEGDSKRRKRRRSRRRKREEKEPGLVTLSENTTKEEKAQADVETSPDPADAGDTNEEKPRRRRRRRGGRRRGSNDDLNLDSTIKNSSADAQITPDEDSRKESELKQRRRRRVRRKNNTETKSATTVLETKESSETTDNFTNRDSETEQIGSVNESSLVTETSANAITGENGKIPSALEQKPVPLTTGKNSDPQVTVVSTDNPEAVSNEDRKGWWQKLVE